jgi:hypothetical protein
MTLSVRMPSAAPYPYRTPVFVFSAATENAPAGSCAVSRRTALSARARGVGFGGACVVGVGVGVGVGGAVGVGLGCDVVGVGEAMDTS